MTDQPLDIQVVPQDMVQSLFTTVSSDGTYITTQDLATMILSLDESKSEHEANEAAKILMKAMDDNHNDLLTLDEFTVALQNNSQLAGAFASQTAIQEKRTASAINDAIDGDGSRMETTRMAALEAKNAVLLDQLAELERHLNANESRYEADIRELTLQGTEQEKLIADLTQRNKLMRHSLDQYAQREAEQKAEESELVAAQHREDEETRDAERRRLHEEFHVQTEDLRADLAESKTTSHKLQEDLDRLNLELSARERDHEMEVKVLESKLRAQEGSFQAIERECHKLRTAVSELDYYREEAMRLKDQLDEVRSEQRDAANRSFSYSTSVSSEVPDQGLQIALLQQEIEDLKEAKAEAIRQLHESARQEKTKLQFTMIAKQLRVDAQTQEMDRLSNEAASLKHENKKLAAQVEALGASLEAMKNFVDTSSKVVSQTKRRPTHHKSPSWSGVFSRRRPSSSGASASADRSKAVESPPKLAGGDDEAAVTPLRPSKPSTDARPSSDVNSALQGSAGNTSITKPETALSTGSDSKRDTDGSNQSLAQEATAAEDEEARDGVDGKKGGIRSDQHNQAVEINVASEDDVVSTEAEA
eukprot:TRINITY_DN4459_c0_g1_i1.p1 TRINITY_DN4459_c0_g1~~TRINITY_DN4459_c0_g1_i1.p1  ORF type:complete len:591 (+),score=133.59 TRINITY_DN4459_c0_g1_i1:178-1950(+)